jgi:hypothetical protein
MVCNTHYYYASGLCPSSGFLQTENTTFRKLDLFPPSGEGGGAPTLQKNQTLAFPQAMPEQTDPVSETLCFLFVEIRTMDKVQKLNSNE